MIYWGANGWRRHAFETAARGEALCGAVPSPTRFTHPLPLCLACLHALWLEQLWPRVDARRALA